MIVEPTKVSSCLGFLNVATIRRFETMPKKLRPISRTTSIMQSLVGSKLCSKSGKNFKVTGGKISERFFFAAHTTHFFAKIKQETGVYTIPIVVILPN